MYRCRRTVSANSTNRRCCLVIMNAVGVRFAGPSGAADAVDTLVSCQLLRYSLSFVVASGSSVAIGGRPGVGVTASLATRWMTGWRSASTQLRREVNSVRSSRRRWLRAVCRSTREMVEAASFADTARHKNPPSWNTRISARSRGSYRTVTSSPT